MSGWYRLLSAIVIAVSAEVWGCSKSASGGSPSSAAAPNGVSQLAGTWINTRPNRAIAVMEIDNDGRVTTHGLQGWLSGEPILGNEQSADTFVLDDGRLAVVVADSNTNSSIFPAIFSGSGLSFGPGSDDGTRPLPLQYFENLRAQEVDEMQELNDKITRAKTKTELDELHAELRGKTDLLRRIDERIRHTSLMSIFYAGVDFRRLGKAQTVAQALHAAMTAAPATQAQ